MKLSKKFSHKNLDGMFRIILLIYVGKKNTKKHVSKFMQDNLRNSIIVNLTEIDFCNRFRKLNSQTGIDLEFFISESPNSKNVQLW